MLNVFNQEKDQEVKLLTMQLNSLRKIVKYGVSSPNDNEIADYLNKMKNEKKKKNC